MASPECGQYGAPVTFPSLCCSCAAASSQLAHVLAQVLRFCEGLTSSVHMQNEAKPSSWMDAAGRVMHNNGLYGRLFYNFQGLKWAAQSYGQAHTGGGFSRAGESVRRTTAKVFPFIGYSYPSSRTLSVLPLHGSLWDSENELQVLAQTLRSDNSLSGFPAECQQRLIN